MKISVVVPAYNAERTVAKTIDSLLNQTLKEEHYEIIIINDGSNDSTSDILNNYNKNSNITIIHQANHGPGYARNMGIDAADGEIIAFTDSDCIPDSNWLKTIFDKFVSSKKMIAGGDVYCHDLIIYPWRVSPAGQKRITANLIITKKALGNIRFGSIFNGMLCEDSDFIFKIEETGINYEYIPELRVKHPVNILTSKSVIKHALSRKYEIKFIQIYGDKAFLSMNALYRPIILHRFSIFGIGFVSALVILIIGVLNALFSQILLVISIGLLAFYFIGYKFLIFNAHHTQHVTPSQKIKSAYFFTIYSFAYFCARVLGSIEYRKIVI